MRQAPNLLKELVEPVVISFGYEFVGVEYKCDNKPHLLRVYIDHETGINVDDCKRVSDQLSGLFDVEDPIPDEYLLEVSSPGLNRPLFSKEQFYQFLGSKVKLRLDVTKGSRRNYTGILREIDGDDVIIEVDDENHKLAFAQIAKANLVFDG